MRNGTAFELAKLKGYYFEVLVEVVELLSLLFLLFLLCFLPLFIEPLSLLLLLLEVFCANAAIPVRRDKPKVATISFFM
jgi:hypothetical protein